MEIEMKEQNPYLLFLDSSDWELYEGWLSWEYTHFVGRYLYFIRVVASLACYQAVTAWKR